MGAIKKFVVIDQSDEIICYINAFTLGKAIDVLKEKYPDSYMHYDMWQIKNAFVSCESIERIVKDVLPEAEDW